MYYDNKSTFYVKQYGPTIFVGICSVLLILSGVFIYYKTTITPINNDNIIAEVPTNNNENIVNKIETEPIDENNALANTEENKNSDYFENLELLVKSKECTVTGVKSPASIVIETDDDIVEVNLIGIDTSYSESSLIEKIRNDLLNKKVKIAYDTVKTVNDANYVYIYLNNKLYNAEILKTGLVTLKSERINVSLNRELAEAQKFARDNSSGIWKK